MAVSERACSTIQLGSFASEQSARRAWSIYTQRYPGLDGHQVGFAMGEAIAHLNHLVTLGHMQLIETHERVRYRRVSPSDARVQPGFE